MKSLIQKSGYIQPGSGGEQYMKYIATRDGVERIESTAGGGYLDCFLRMAPLTWRR